MSRTIWLVLYAILLSIWPLQAAVHRVSHDDSSIQYIPSVCNLSCTRVCRNQWWVTCLSDGLASHRTKGNNTSANFSFRGSSITLYTRTAPDGGKAVVYIDAGDPQSLDTYSPVTNEADPKYSKTGLDPNKQHTISVVYDVQAFTNDVERFVDVRYFDYDDGGGGSGGTNNQVTSSSPVSSNAPGGGSTTTTTSTHSGMITTMISGSLVTMNPTQTSSSRGLTDVGPAGISFGGSSSQSSDGANPNTAAIGSSPTNKIELSTASIVGIILGALALGAVCFLCFFWVLRKRMTARRDGFKSRFGTQHAFSALKSKERLREPGLNTARTSRAPSIASPFEENSANLSSSTPHDSVTSLQLYELSHQRGTRNEAGYILPWRIPAKYTDQRVVRQNPPQEEGTTVITEDVSETVMSPTVNSSLPPQNGPRSTGEWGRVLGEPMLSESGETFREKGPRILSPPQSQIADNPGDEVVSGITETVRSGTPPPMYTA